MGRDTIKQGDNMYFGCRKRAVKKPVLVKGLVDKTEKEGEKILTKTYNELLSTGCTMTVNMSIELSNYQHKDFEEVLHEYAANSHQFYLEISRLLKNKL